MTYWLLASLGLFLRRIASYNAIPPTPSNSSGQLKMNSVTNNEGGNEANWTESLWFNLPESRTDMKSDIKCD